MKKNEFVQILIPIIIVLVLAFGGWYLFTTQKTQIKNVPQLTRSNLKEYTTKGILVKEDFPKYMFSYPSDWQVNEDAKTKGLPQDNVSISKNGYIIHIDQEIRTGAGACYFNDSPTVQELNSPGTDLQTVKYEEMDSNFGHLRYFRWISEDGTPENSYGFCEKWVERSVALGKNVYTVTTLGYITLSVSSNGDPVVFQEALDIVKSIKPLQ